MGKLYRLWGPIGEAPGSGVSISFPKGQLFSTLQSNGQEEMGVVSSLWVSPNCLNGQGTQVAI